MVRAPALHAGALKFGSCTAHDLLSRRYRTRTLRRSPRLNPRALFSDLAVHFRQRSRSTAEGPVCDRNKPRWRDRAELKVSPRSIVTISSLGASRSCPNNPREPHGPTVDPSRVSGRPLTLDRSGRGHIPDTADNANSSFEAVANSKLSGRWKM